MPRCAWCASTPTSRSSTPSTTCRPRSTWSTSRSAGRSSTGATGAGPIRRPSTGPASAACSSSSRPATTATDPISGPTATRTPAVTRRDAASPTSSTCRVATMPWRFLVGAGETAFVSLQWDAWPNTAQDFDLYIERRQRQHHRGQRGHPGRDRWQRPADRGRRLHQHNRSTTASTSCSSNRYAGQRGPRMDIFFDGGVFAIEAPTGSSISDPAVAHGAMAVGAHCYSDGAVEFFSSVGPTIDGRVKPDISGPDATSSTCTATPTRAEQRVLRHLRRRSPRGGRRRAAARREPRPRRGRAAAAARAQGHRRRPRRGSTTLRRRAPPPRRHRRCTPAGSPSVHAGWTRPVCSTAGPARPPTRGDREPDHPHPGGRHPAGAGARRLHRCPRRRGRRRPQRHRGRSHLRRVRHGVPRRIRAERVQRQLRRRPDGRPSTSPPPSAADDRVRLYNAAGNTHLLVDIAGWYGPTGDGWSERRRHDTPRQPRRAMDTRAGSARATPRSVDRTTPIGARPDARPSTSSTGPWSRPTPRP